MPEKGPDVNDSSLRPGRQDRSTGYRSEPPTSSRNGGPCGLTIRIAGSWTKSRFI